MCTLVLEGSSHILNHKINNEGDKRRHAAVTLVDFRRKSGWAFGIMVLKRQRLIFLLTKSGGGGRGRTHVSLAVAVKPLTPTPREDRD